nr:VWA domain-containing protein [Robbsia betulipollinis]
MMIATLCLALDTIDQSMTLSRMQSALDVATLSAGGEARRFATATGSNLAQWQADARAYYNANMSAGYANVTMPDKNFTATVVGDATTGRTIALSATGSLSLIAPFTLGQSGLTVSVGNNAATASAATTGALSVATTTVSVTNSALALPKSTLELVMVLDNTGSMIQSINGVTKMDGLHAAANTLVTDLLTASSADSYIGLVPFATTVNVLNALPAGGSWLSPTFSYNSKNVNMASWGGCTAEPRDGNGYLYPKPYSPNDSMKFTPYYYNVPPAGLAVRTYSNFPTCNATPQATTIATSVPLNLLTSGEANVCGFTGNQIGNGIGVYFDQAPVTKSNSATTAVTQNTDCIAHPVTFLTNNATTLKNGINAMSPNGSTIIPVGILWGWRMLSSSWSGDNAGSGNGWISSDTSFPKPETTPGLQRVMIVLTDGENQMGKQYHLPNDLYFNGLSGVGTNKIPAPTVARSDGTTLANATMDYTETMPLPSDGQGYSNDINDFQLGVCAAIKQSGITIYAITFGAVSTTGASTMQSCASSGNYYHAPDSAALDTIFQQIAGSLGILRLTQ